MWRNVGIIRDAAQLSTALRELERLQEQAATLTAADKSQLQLCLEVQDMVRVALVIVVAALERKESRGAHYRADYPQMDVAWEKNIIVYKDSDGRLATKVVPLVTD